MAEDQQQQRREPFLVLDQSQQYQQEFVFSAQSGQFIPQKFEEEVSVEGSRVNLTHMVGDVQMGQLLEIGKSTFDIEEFDSSPIIYEELDDIELDFADSQSSSEGGEGLSFMLEQTSLVPIQNETPAIEVNENLAEEDVNNPPMPFEDTDTEANIWPEIGREEIDAWIKDGTDPRPTVQIAPKKFVTKLKHINLFVSL